MQNRISWLGLTSLVLITLVIGLFQNCAKFTAGAIVSGSVAGTSYCNSHQADSACTTAAAGVCTFNGQSLKNGQSISAYHFYPVGDSFPGLTPIYRLHLPSNNDYLLSINGDEIAAAMKLGYLNDGVLGWGFGPGDSHGVPMQNSYKSGVHFFTLGLGEAQQFGTVEGVRFSLVPY